MVLWKQFPSRFIWNSMINRCWRVLQMLRDDCSLQARRPKACSDNSGARAMHWVTGWHQKLLSVLALNAFRLSALFPLIEGIYQIYIIICVCPCSCGFVCSLFSSTSHGLIWSPSIPMNSLWLGRCFKNTWKLIGAKKFFLMKYLYNKIIVIPNRCPSEHLSFRTLPLPLPLGSNAGASVGCRRHQKRE